MKVIVESLFPDKIVPFKFACGTIYKAVFESIGCSASFFGATEDQKVYWVDCKKGDVYFSQGGVYSTSFLGESASWPRMFEEFEVEVEQQIGAIQFLLQVASTENLNFVDIEIEIKENNG